jgi:hypothetical protein
LLGYAADENDAALCWSIGVAVVNRGEVPRAMARCRAGRLPSETAKSAGQLSARSHKMLDFPLILKVNI